MYINIGRNEDLQQSHQLDSMSSCEFQPGEGNGVGIGIPPAGINTVEFDCTPSTGSG